MSRVGPAKVTARFTWDKGIDGIENLYLEALATKEMDSRAWLAQV
jgi:hypothetical protein